MNSLPEYKEVVKDYSSPVGKYFCVLALGSEPSCIQMTSLEKKSYKVKVGLDGWYVEGSEKDVYPTFESLAFSLSPLFQRQFWGELNMRLDEI